MSLLKKLAGETVIYGISNVSSRLINFLLVPYLTTVLKNTEDYGSVSELYSYVGFLMVLMTYRMETGFFRFASKAEDPNKVFTTVMRPLLITTPIVVGLLILFAQPIADFIAYPDAPRYVIWFACILGLDTLTRVPLAKLRLESRPMVFLLAQMTNVLVNIGVAFFFLSACPWLIENGYEWATYIYDDSSPVDYVFIANVVASAAVLLVLLPYFKGVGGTIDRDLLKKIFKYIAPLIVVGIAAIINETLDKPLLKWLLPGTLDENKAQMGIYAANYKLAALMTIMVTGFNYAAEPFFFKNRDRKDARVLYGQVSQSFAMVGGLAFLGIMLFSDIVLQILGDSYNQQGSEIIPIVLLANLFLGLYYNFGIWYKLADKTRMGMYMALMGATITLVINFTLIPSWGYMASAWATFACYFSMAIVAYLLGQKYYPIHYPIWRILGYVGLGIGLYQLHLWIHVEGILDYIIRGVLLLTYVAVVYWLERNQLFKAIFQKG